ncbi:MAG: M6 family metalloprotease domain-containing protein [Bacteroidales bacterium]|nr:M6 family metalloprotease domain-containing protein [Bacteroidales bacterium]
MNKKTLAIIIFLLAGLSATAGPAKPGPINLRQPNGYSFTATLKGDEFGHVLTTTDGCGIIQDRDGYYSYAYYDAEGHRYSSGVHVGDKASSDALVGSRQIPWQAIKTLATQKRAQEAAIQNNETPILSRIRGGRTVDLASLRTEPGTKIKTLSDDSSVKHGLVILAEFSDLAFTYTKSDFVSLLTQEGYELNGATGSAKEYFDAQFGGLFDFQFTVSDIVTLSNERAYYGGNDSTGSDEHPEEMIREACELADNDIDFSLFDDDGDGIVDNVFVFFAGGDEAQGAGDDCIWSHAWYLYSGAGISLTLDGVQIDRYACSSELYLSSYEYYMTGIGTFCHEYSHTFGLPDLYDTDYDNPAGSAVAAGLWMSTSLMDGGNYNNDGNTPPYYNAVERDWLGLWEPETLEAGEYTLEPIEQNGRYYKMETGVEGEFFLFECRHRSGWDQYINHGSKASGMLIYHIDQSATRSVYSPTYDINTSPYLRWTVYNEVNADPDHQCADLVEADNRSDQSTSTAIYSAALAGIFFPSGRTDFTPESEPAFRTWDDYSSNLSITEISEDDDDNVLFTVINSNDIATPYATNIGAVTFQDAAIISWDSDYATTRKAYISVSDSPSEEHEVTAYDEGNYAYVADNLSPGTTYTVKIWYEDYDYNPGDIKTYSFTTQTLSSSNTSYAYIYFTTPANDDGSFTTGTKAPLRVWNATDADSVEWKLGTSDIEVGDDGYYELSTAGTLKATVTYKDGTTEIITRKITLKSAAE